MSAKIYNGFRLTQMNINEINSLMKDVKKDIYLEVKNNLIKDFLKYRFKMIDYKLLNKKFYMSDILGHLEFDLSKDNDTDFKYTGNLEKDLLILYQKLCSTDTYKRQVDFDKSCIIHLFPYKKNKTLGVFLSEDLSYLYKLIKKNKKVLDYMYQNSTDKPRNISKRLWEIRYKDWMNVDLNKKIVFPIFDNSEQINILEDIIKKYNNRDIDKHYFENFSHEKRFYYIARKVFLNILTNKYLKINLKGEKISSDNIHIYSRSFHEARQFYLDNKNYCEKRINKLKSYYLEKINNLNIDFFNYFYQKENHNG